MAENFEAHVGSEIGLLLGSHNLGSSRFSSRYPAAFYLSWANFAN